MHCDTTPVNSTHIPSVHCIRARQDYVAISPCSRGPGETGSRRYEQVMVGESASTSERALTLVWSGSATYSQGVSLWDCADRTGRWLSVQPTHLDLELRQSNIDCLVCS